MEINNKVSEKKKTSLGRRKIALDRKIEKKSNLQVTFTKRRQGMFKKAAELSLMCGVDIAILVRSPAGKIFAFGSPSADAVVRRFEGESSTSGQNVERLEGSTEYEPTTSGQIVEKRESAVAVVRRFEGESSTSGQNVERLEGSTEYEPTTSGQIVERLEGSKEYEPTTSGQFVEKREQTTWWNRPIESMGLEELEQFALKLEALQSQSAIPAS